MADFEGRTALITGGSRGIGAAVARTLAARGADIAINYHSNREAAEAVASEVVVDLCLRYASQRWLALRSVAIKSSHPLSPVGTWKA